MWQMRLLFATHSRFRANWNARSGIVHLMRYRPAVGGKLPERLICFSEEIAYRIDNRYPKASTIALSHELKKGTNA
jgi:hypothetical protein